MHPSLLVTQYGTQCTGFLGHSAVYCVMVCGTSVYHGVPHALESWRDLREYLYIEGTRGTRCIGNAEHFTRYVVHLFTVTDIGFGCVCSDTVKHTY